MTEFWNENQTQIIIGVIVLAVVQLVTGALGGAARWLWDQWPWRKPVLPSGEFPFRYARFFAELEAHIGELLPHLHGDMNIAYQPRLPPQEQEELQRLIDGTRFLVLVGRTGLGKTREGVEAIRRIEAHVREPVTVLLPRAPFTPNFTPPGDVSTDHIVLFVDNLHGRPFYAEGVGESTTAASGDAAAWLRQCLTYFRASHDFRVIATARDDLPDRDYQESTQHIRPVTREFGFVEERLASWSQSNLDGLVNAVAEWRDITIPADARAELARRCGAEGTPNYAQLAVAEVERGGSFPLDQVRSLPPTFDTLWQRTWEKRIAPYWARMRLFEALSLIQQAGLTPYIPVAVELAARMWGGPLWWRRARVRAALRALNPWIEAKATTLECPEAYLPQSVSFGQDGRAALVSRTLRDLLSRSPERLATEAGNLGNFLWQYPLGSRRENLEEAIGCFRRALEVRTKEAFPVDWAMTQHNLGNAYSDRIAGVTAENLEEAIGCFRRALDVYTRDAFLVDWAMTQNNLGATYWERIAGERDENLEEAIGCYRRALEVRTKEAFPVDWAMTQHNLGNAYSDRIAGVTAKNLEEAIGCYRRALDVYTRDAFPVQWATTQNSLDNAYRYRIAGVRAENLEEAIGCFRRALEVRTRDAFPVEPVPKVV